MMLAPATTIVLVISPSLNADGRKAYSTRGQLFDGKVDGRCIVERSTTPLCDAARVLLAEGVRSKAKIVMRHTGSLADALRSTVGAAAGLVVEDDSGGKPVFRKWRPDRFDGRSSVALPSPVPQNESPATLVPDRTHPKGCTAVRPFDDCFGQPAADMRMAEVHLRRAVRRAQRMAEQGVQPTGIYADAARVQNRAR
jgi:hypothetical protein